MENDALTAHIKNKEQKEAMEIAEAAREEKLQGKSFTGQLFMGEFDPSLIFPFPKQSQEEKVIGDTFIKQLKLILKEHLDPNQVDETRTIPQIAIDEMAKLGVFAMKVPKKYNGLGFSQVNYNRVMTVISSYCASTAVLVSAHQSIGVPQPLRDFGTEEQKQQFFPRFRDGAISAFALTEPDVGSDPAKMVTQATPSEDGTHYIINGDKLWCTNGPIADILVVMVKTPSKMIHGKERAQISAFIVEGKSEGIEVVQRCDFMGIRGIQNGLIRFTNVKVPAENLIGGLGKGLALALTTLNTGRLTIPAANLGLAKKCLSICRDWGNERVQWGLPVGLHEEGRQKVAHIASSTFAIEAITHLTSHWSDEHKQDIRIEAAMAKLFCSELGWKIIDETLQFRGGRGYERESSLKARGEKPYPVERMLRDTRINLIIEGTTEIMKLFLAREAMNPHLSLAKDLLSRHSGIFKKAKTAIKMIGFYSLWYPKQWNPFNPTSKYSSVEELAPYFAYVSKNSRRLSRALFHAMAKYRQNLEKKQMLLGRLIWIGTELFAISATCSYAASLHQQDRSNKTPLTLARHFSEGAKARIKDHFKAIKSNLDHSSNELAEEVLKGEISWLEKGIM